MVSATSHARVTTRVTLNTLILLKFLPRGRRSTITMPKLLFGPPQVFILKNKIFFFQNQTGGYYPCITMHLVLCFAWRSTPGLMRTNRRSRSMPSMMVMQELTLLGLTHGLVINQRLHALANCVSSRHVGHPARDASSGNSWHRSGCAGCGTANGQKAAGSGCCTWSNCRAAERGHVRSRQYPNQRITVTVDFLCNRGSMATELGAETPALLSGVPAPGGTFPAGTGGTYRGVWGDAPP